MTQGQSRTECPQRVGGLYPCLIRAMDGKDQGYRGVWPIAPVSGEALGIGLGHLMERDTQREVLGIVGAGMLNAWRDMGCHG